MVNRIARTLILLSAILFQWIPQAYAQHNALTIRVDTLTIQATDNDLLIGVYQKLTGAKPADFYGYDARLSYDTLKLRATGVFFQGTASEYLSYQISNTASAGDIRVVTLGQSGQGVDTTNPLLFLIRFSVISRSFDTARITLYRFDTTSAPMIDTIHMVSGWIRHQPQGPPPAKVTLTLTSPQQSGESDSIVTLPIQVSDLTHANLHEGQLACTVDTTVMRFLGSTPGKIAGDTLKTRDSVAGSAVLVTVSNSDTSQAVLGTGTLMNLRFKLSKRSDTACAELTNLSFTATNSDALIDSVIFSFGELCDLGRIDSPSVVRPKRLLTDAALTVWPDPLPVTSALRIETSVSGECELRIIDPIGRELLKTQFSEHYDWWPKVFYPSGAYLVRVTPKKTAARPTDSRFVMIH